MYERYDYDGDLYKLIRTFYIRLAKDDLNAILDHIAIKYECYECDEELIELLEEYES